MDPKDDPLLPENLYRYIAGLEAATALSLALLFRNRIADLDRLEDLAVSVNAPDEKDARRIGFRRLAKSVRQYVGVLDEMDRTSGA
jgi:hypothetical protein